MIRCYKKSRFSYTVLGGLLVLAVAAVGLTKAQTPGEPATVSPVSPIVAGTQPPALEEKEKPKTHFTNIPPGTPTVDFRGKFVLPDGSPATGYGISLSGNIGASHKPFFARTETGKDGTFQIEVVPDHELVMTIYAQDTDGQRFSLKPRIFVAQADMEPLNITLEEGVPVRGKIVFENGLPAAGCLLYFREQEPIGVIETQGENRSNTRKVSHFQSAKTDNNGEYVAYLLPGEYTTHSRNETIKIEKTDTEKRLDVLTFPTPIFIEMKLADGSSVESPYLDSWFPLNDSSARRDPGNTVVRVGDSFRFESAGTEGTLYIVDRNARQGTIEKITPEMVGTTQHFQLKPMGSATVRFVDANNKPMSDKQVRPSYKHQDSTATRHTAYWSIFPGKTDTDGRVTFPVFSGKTSIALPLPDSGSGRPFPASVGGAGYRIDKELDLAPGENVDLGTVKLIRVFGSSKHVMSNIQINEMRGPNTPIGEDRQMVSLVLIENGAYEILLPPGHYRFSGINYILSISEDSKDIQLDFDAAGQGTIKEPGA